MSWIRRLELAVSAWLVVAPFMVGYGGPAFWSDILVGLLAGIVRLVGWRENRPWWALLPFGAWLLMAPFLLGYLDVPGAVANALVAGALLTVAAVFRWRLARRQRRARV